MNVLVETNQKQTYRFLPDAGSFSTFRKNLEIVAEDSMPQGRLDAILLVMFKEFLS